jgi:hypothetical protein
MRQPKKRRYRHKFTGLRDDTQIVDEEATDSKGYNKRNDASKYPKPTTITVNKATLALYAVLREQGKYNNYDELLVDIVEYVVNQRMLFSRNHQLFKMDEQIPKDLERIILRAKNYLQLKDASRKQAIRKMRYKRRETGKHIRY